MSSLWHVKPGLPFRNNFFFWKGFDYALFLKLMKMAVVMIMNFLGEMNDQISALNLTSNKEIWQTTSRIPILKRVNIVTQYC